MEKQIYLEEILCKVFYDNAIKQPNEMFSEITHQAIKCAMKKAIEEALQIASEDAEFDLYDGCMWGYATSSEVYIKKQSILDTINKVV
jgi:hypothetical protein